MFTSDLLSEILNLPAPWTIDSIDVDHDENEVHVRLNHEKGVQFSCPECDAACHTHDHTKERDWQHLNLWQYKTFISARLPRVICKIHGVHQINVPWAEKSSRLTLLLERLAIDTLIGCETIDQAAKLLGLSWDMVCGVMERAVNRGLERKGSDHGVLKFLGVDEKAYRKGHKYITIVYNHLEKRVEFISDDRREDSLDQFFDELTTDQIKSIKGVSMDMWDPYAKSVEKHVPDGNRKIVHDKFHIMKHANEAVDDVRKAEHRRLIANGDHTLTGSMHMLRYASENLPDKYEEQFEQLMQADLDVGRAWAFKESLRRLWDMPNRRAARNYIKRWREEVHQSGIKPMIKVSDMIWKRLTKVASYCELRISNGFAEGMNSKIQVIKRKARGYRSKEMFKTAIMFFCGGLDLYPTIFSHTKP